MCPKCIVWLLFRRPADARLSVWGFRLRPAGAPETPVRNGEKQTRVADGNRGVRVIDAMERLVAVIREPSAINRYLSARNAAAVCDHRGRLRAIRLASFGDDRGTAGERHGSSLITTERCKSDGGEYIGGLLETGTPIAIKHKLDRSEKK